MNKEAIKSELISETNKMINLSTDRFKKSMGLNIMLKTKLILFYFFCVLQTSYSQNDKIETTLITLDLSNPSEESLLSTFEGNKLVVKNRNPIAFKLINGNPFRYKYVLTYEKTNLFTNKNFVLKPDDSEIGENYMSSNYEIEIDTINVTIDEDYIKRNQELIKYSIESLNTRVDSFISEISSVDNLENEEFTLYRDIYKDEFDDVILKKQKSQGEFNFIDVSDNIILENQKEIDSQLLIVKEKIKKLFSVKFETYLLPIDINGDNIDYIEISLERYDSDNPKPEVYKYKIWIRGGLKIDISGGVYITSLFDNEYYLKDNGDPMNTNKLIYESNNGGYDFGFGTMVNISLRGGSWVRPTLNFGVLFTSNQTFQMLTGVGVILGKNERIILHGGLSMGRVNVLRNNYKTDGLTSYDLGVDGTIPIDKEFKFGNFFGITYNFSKPKSNKSTSE